MQYSHISVLESTSGNFQNRKWDNLLGNSMHLFSKFLRVLARCELVLKPVAKSRPPACCMTAFLQALLMLQSPPPPA